MTDQQHKEHPPVEESGTTEPKESSRCKTCEETMDKTFDIFPICHVAPGLVRLERHGEADTLIVQCIECEKEVARFQVLQSVPAGRSQFSSHREHIYVFGQGLSDLEHSRGFRMIRWFESALRERNVDTRCGKHDRAREEALRGLQNGECACCERKEEVLRVDHFPDGEIRRLLCLDCSYVSALMGYEHAAEIVDSLFGDNDVRPSVP